MWCHAHGQTRESTSPPVKSQDPGSGVGTTKKIAMVDDRLARNARVRRVRVRVASMTDSTVDRFMLCFYKTQITCSCMLLMQTTTSGITQSTGKPKHNHKSSSSTPRRSTKNQQQQPPRKTQLHACENAAASEKKKWEMIDLQENV